MVPLRQWRWEITGLCVITCANEGEEKGMQNVVMTAGSEARDRKAVVRR